MQTATLHFVDNSPLVALIGNPNCGKTAIFNALTGSHQKVANYAGVTVERKEGKLTLGEPGKNLRILDLPGAYSLYPRSLDERVTHDVLKGLAAGEKRPDLAVCVVDATNLRRTLKLALAVQRLGLPCVLALNMSDLAQKRGLRIDPQALAHALGMPVIPTVGIQAHGVEPLKAHLVEAFASARARAPTPPPLAADGDAPDSQDVQRIQSILHDLGLDPARHLE